MNFNEHPTRTAQVNKTLADLGISERLFRGNGYYYFGEGDASRWPQSGVYVYRITSLTLQQWLFEWHTLSTSRDR